MSKTDQQFEQPYNYWNTRTLYLIDEILMPDTSEYSCVFLDQLIELNARDKTKPIMIVIKCYGGSVSTMWSIIDYMKAIDAPVYTQASGDVASAASVILACGEKGHRYVTPNSRVMVHEPWACGIGGRAEEVAGEAKLVKRSQERYYALLSEITGFSLQRLKKDMRTDKWLWGQEAVDYNLVDSVGVLPELINLSVDADREQAGLSLNGVPKRRTKKCDCTADK